MWNMGAHPKAINRLTTKIQLARKHGLVEQLDRALDDLYDITCRATEWDADQWGFHPSWMAAERNLMDWRGGDGTLYPREVSKHELEIPPGTSTPDRTTA